MGPHEQSSDGHEHRHLWGRLSRYFLSGVLVSAPLVVTFYILWGTITFIDEKVKSIIPYKDSLQTLLLVDIPGAGLIVGFVGFTLIGFFAAGIMGRFFLRLGEDLLNRTPLVRGLYNAVKQIFEAVFQKNTNSFKEVVMVEFPRKGIWSLGFVTGVTEGQIQKMTQETVVNVFVPTTPNPTSGFLIFVPQSELVHLSFTVEEGIKMVVSAGIITPKEALNKQG